MAGGNELGMGGPTNKFDSLTGRERQVQHALTRGLSDQQIAAELCISVSTVKTHVRSILKKLGAKSRYQVAEIHE